MILVDSSVWIETFRREKPLDLLTLLEFEEVVTCLPVIQEVLQGFGDESAFREAEDAMFSLPMVEAPISTEVYRVAIDLYRTGRSTGFTIRSSVDCLIAACALRHDLVVLHRDRDFSHLARFSRLRQREV